MTISDRLVQPGWIPWSPLAAILAILFVAVPLILTSELLAAFKLVDDSGDPVGYTGLVAFLLVPFSAIFVTIYAWVRLIEKRQLSTLGLQADRLPQELTKGVAIGVVTTLFLVASIWAFGYLKIDGLFSAFTSSTALAKISLLFLCFGVQSGAEEFLFRGWLMSAVRHRAGITWAVAISTAVFTFLHWSPGQPWYEILSSISFSLFASALVIKTGSLAIAAGWHIGWNWLVGTGFGLPITGLDLNLPALLFEALPTGSEIMSGGSGGPESSIFCSILLASLCLYMWLKK